jgi:hypothetical protein
MTKLDQEPLVVDLARVLQLTGRGQPLERIRAHATRFVEECRSALPDLTTLGELRSLLCDRLSICLRVVNEDQDLHTVADEFGFSELERRSLIREFDHEDVEGWLIANPSYRPGLRRWIAIVDGRGSRAVRAYFTGWHEITHAIVTPHQLELTLRRSIPVDKTKDPIEAVVDVVTGDLAFYSPLVAPVFREEVRRAGGSVTLAVIDAMRLRVAPEASFQSAAIAAARMSDRPMLVTQVERQYKPTELRAMRSPQGELALPGGQTRPTPKLRVAMAVPASKSGSGLSIFKPMRVPLASVLSDAYDSSEDVRLQAEEDQDWWETSSGGCLPSQRMRVEAMRRGSYVYGLLVPI